MSNQELQVIIKALQDLAGSAKTAALGLKGGLCTMNTAFFLQKTIDLMQDENRINQFKKVLDELSVE